MSGIPSLVPFGVALPWECPTRQMRSLLKGDAKTIRFTGTDLLVGKFFEGIQGIKKCRGKTPRHKNTKA